MFHFLCIIPLGLRWKQEVLLQFYVIGAEEEVFKTRETHFNKTP